MIDHAVVFLTKNKYTCLDWADFFQVSQWLWQFTNCGYAVRTQHVPVKATVYLHRVIMEPPEGFEVDHISGDKLDNRRSNLRLCTRSQNTWNTPKSRMPATSRFKGVCWMERDNAWKAQIRREGRLLFVGHYDTEEDAARSYDRMVKEFDGEFARLNFPDINTS